MRQPWTYAGDLTRKLGVTLLVLLLHALLGLMLLVANNTAVQRLADKAASTALLSPTTPNRTIIASLIQPTPSQPSSMATHRTSPPKKTSAAATPASTTAITTEPLAGQAPATGNHPEHAPRSIDYSTINATVKGIAAQGKERVLPGTTRQLNAAEKFEQAVGQAGRQDCKTQHANLGLLAIPFLIRDTFSDDGCKW